MKPVFVVAACSGLLIGATHFSGSKADISSLDTLSSGRYGGICGLQGDRKDCRSAERQTAVSDKASERVAVNIKTSKRETPPVAVAPDTRTEAPKDTFGGAVISMTKAKTVKLRFLGYNELTGEYSINADATVSIPVLGRISVANLSAPQLEEILSERVSAVTGRKGYATVEVSEYRSVFVTGVVKDSKSINWIPGMTVLHAIALAGGTSLGGGAGVSVPLSKNTEKGRVQTASNDLKRLLSVRARLLAERAGSDKVEVPERLIEIVGHEEAQRLIAAQNELLKAMNDGYTSHTQMINQAITTTSEELDSVKKRQVLIDSQIALVRKQRAQYRDLQKRSLVSNTALIDLETKVAEAEEKNVSAVIDRSKLASKLLDLRRELIDIKQKKQAEVDQKILEVEREIEDKEINLKTASRAVMTLDKDSAFGLEDNGSATAGYEIVRYDGTGTNRLKAGEMTTVQPGDVVIVSR